MIVCDAEVVHVLWKSLLETLWILCGFLRFFAVRQRRHLSLCIGVRVISKDAKILFVLQIIDCCAIVFEAIRFHRTVHIALRSFFRFLQCTVVHLIIKAVFKVMIDVHEIALFDFRYDSLGTCRGFRHFNSWCRGYFRRFGDNVSLRLLPGLLQRRKLLFILLRQIPIFSDQVFNAFYHVGPRQAHFRATVFPVPDTLAIMFLPSAVASTEGMRVSADAVGVL